MRTVRRLACAVPVLIAVSLIGCGSGDNDDPIDSAPPQGGLYFPTLPQERAARLQSQNNLRLLGLATMNFSTTHRKYPAVASFDNQNKPLLSWRVNILPYLDQQNLYRAFKLDQPWDSEHNKALIDKMPKVYSITGKNTSDGLTYYEVLVCQTPGSRTLFQFPQQGAGPTAMPVSNVSSNAASNDGSSNVILMVESNEPVPWTKPTWLDYDPSKPLPKLGGLYPNAPGFHAAIADGSAKFIRQGVSEGTVRHAITFDDGNLLGSDW